MKEKIGKVLMFMGNVYTDMELADKILYLVYAAFLILGVLFRYEVFPTPVDLGDLLVNHTEYGVYSASYMLISITNIIMIAFALTSEWGLKNQVKMYWRGSEYSGYYGFGKRKFTFYSMFGSAVVLSLMLFVNFYVFSIFIILNIIMLILLAIVLFNFIFR